MTSAELLNDAFGRIRALVHRVVDGLTPEQLSYRIEAETNSIAWLAWHLTRIQDDHVADVAETEQIWTAKGWKDRFGLPFDVSATGFGHSSDEVAAVRVESGELLTGYHDAVYQRTLDYVKPLTDEDLARIVDESYDPPVSLGVRLVSVISDNLQHAGQAAFVRGIIGRR
ncbi:MAG: mycothiol transferase [Actinomycetota bacterium]